MEMVLRATAIYFFLFIVSRAVGRRTLSELSAFELMLLVIVGDLIQQGVTQNDMSVTGAALAVGTIACWTVIFSYVTFRWKKTSPVIEGIPVVVIKDGKLVEQALHYERVPLDEVMIAAREQGIDDIAQVRVGLIEADGKFSFIKNDGDKADRPDQRAG